MKTMHFFTIVSLFLTLATGGVALAEDHHHSGDYSFGVANGAAAVIEPEPGEEGAIHLLPFTGGLFSGDWGVEFWNLLAPDLSAVRVLFGECPDGFALYHEGAMILGTDGSQGGVGYFDMGWPDPGVHHAHLDAYATAPGTYLVNFRLVDGVSATSGSLVDSGEYTLEFEAVPEPSGLLALAMPLVALAVRRRR